MTRAGRPARSVGKFGRGVMWRTSALGEIHLIISHPLTASGKAFIGLCPHFGVQGAWPEVLLFVFVSC